jgi:hypothetical protein
MVLRKGSGTGDRDKPPPQPEKEFNENSPDFDVPGGSRLPVTPDEVRARAEAQKQKLRDDHEQNRAGLEDAERIRLRQQRATTEHTIWGTRSKPRWTPEQVEEMAPINVEKQFQKSLKTVDDQTQDHISGLMLIQQIDEQSQQHHMDHGHEWSGGNETGLSGEFSRSDGPSDGRDGPDNSYER